MLPRRLDRKDPREQVVPLAWPAEAAMRFKGLAPERPDRFQFGFGGQLWHPELFELAT